MSPVGENPKSHESAGDSAALSRDVLAKLRERAEHGVRALDPAITLRLVAQAERALPPEKSSVVYQVLAPVKRADGYCTTDCVYDLNGVCERCGCFDPARFLLLEMPTEAQDKARAGFQTLVDAGIDVQVRRV